MNKSFKNSNRSNQDGFIKYVIIIIVAILILSYFGFNIRSIAESDTSKGNFSYVWGWVSHVWNTFLLTPAHYIWDKIVIGIIWEMIIKPSMDHIGKLQK